MTVHLRREPSGSSRARNDLEVDLEGLFVGMGINGVQPLRSRILSQAHSHEQNLHYGENLAMFNMLNRSVYVGDPVRKET